MDINYQIIRILKKHPEGGEKFFNALDFIIRSDLSILDVFTEFVGGASNHGNEVAI